MEYYQRDEDERMCILWDNPKENIPSDFVMWWTRNGWNPEKLRSMPLRQLRPIYQRYLNGR